MADVESNINVNIDTSSALASIRRLQSELSAFHTSMAKGGAAAAATSAQLQQGLMNSVNATGQFTASMKRVSSTTESFTSSLEKNKLSMREYFRYSAGSFKTFSNMFTKEFNTIEKVARERVKTLQTQYIQVGRDASGAMKAIAIRPQVLDMDDLGTKTAIASQKMQILNQMVKQGSTNLLNFGKNTQWAGRQLMVGFSIPLGIAGAAAAREFMKLEEQAIRFKRVYGDTFTPTGETDKMVEEIKGLADAYTTYGIAVEKTMSLAADAAAMGKTGADLLAQVDQASKLAVLGGVDQQKALETTISLTSAFGTATRDLAKDINFLNAVENQTVTSIDDLTEAIPTAAPVIQQLGGDVRDLAFFLTAMREGGINASEGANALKSGLASMINPSRQATDLLAEFGVNLQGIVDGNKGNVKQMIVDLGLALDGLDPTNRARAIEQLFGKFQFARMSTLFQNVIKDGTQAGRVLELTAKSAAELSVLSQREMEKISESPMFKFQAAVEQFQAALAPLGEAFLKAVTPIIEFGTKILDEFNKMDAGAKNFVVVLAAALGGIAPILLMSFGLVANGVANLIKFFAFVGKTMLGVGRNSQTLGGQLDYMTQQQLEAAAVAASLDQSHNKLIQTFTSEAGAVNNLTAAYERAAAASSRIGLGGVGRAVKGKKMASGGIVSGPGGPKSDSVPAMLSNGEAVIPAEVVKKYPGLVNGLIAGNVGKHKDGKQNFAHIGPGVNETAGEALAQSGSRDYTKKALRAIETLVRLKLEGEVVRLQHSWGMKMSENVNINLAKPEGADITQVGSQFAGKKEGVADRWQESLKLSGQETSKRLLQELNNYEKSMSAKIRDLKNRGVQRIVDTDKQLEQIPEQQRKLYASLESLDRQVIKEIGAENKKLVEARKRGLGTIRDVRVDVAAGSAADKKIRADKDASSVFVRRRGSQSDATRSGVSVQSGARGGMGTMPAQSRTVSEVTGGKESQTRARRISEADARASMTPAQKRKYTMADEAGKKALLAAQRRQIRAAEIEADIAEREAATAKRRESARKGVETRRANAEARAAAAVEQEAATTQKRSLRSRISSGVRGMGRGIGGGASMALMMGSSMLPEGMGAGGAILGATGMGASMGSMLGPYGTAAGAALGLVASSAMAVKEAFDSAQRSAETFAKETKASSYAIQKLSEITGQVSATEEMNKRRSDAATYKKTEETNAVVAAYSDSEQGKATTAAIGEALAKGNTQAAITNLSSQMTTAIASGAINAVDAKAIVDDIGTQIGDKTFSLKANAQIENIVGPNGENLDKDPINVRLNILKESGKQIEQSAKSVSLTTFQQSQDTVQKNTGIKTTNASKLFKGDMGEVSDQIWNVVNPLGAMIGNTAALFDYIGQLGSVSGEFASNVSIAASQSQQMLDSLQLDYEKRIEIAKAAGDTAEAERLATEYINGRKDILAQNAANRQLAQDQYAKTDGLMKTSVIGSLDQQIKDMYAEGPLKDSAQAAIDKLGGSSGLGGTAEFTLKTEIAAGTLNVTALNSLLDLYKAEGEDANILADLVVKIGGADASRVMQFAAMADSPEKTIKFTADISAENPEDAAKILDTLDEIGKVGGDKLLSIAVNAPLNKIKQLQKDLEGLDELFANGPITGEVIFNTYGLKLSEEATDYFNGLSPSDQKVYTTALLTVKDTLDLNNKADAAKLKDWYASAHGGKAAFLKNYNQDTALEEYREYLARSNVESAQSAANSFPVDTGTGDGGGGGGGGSEEAPRTIAEVIADQQKRITAINDQTTAVRKLVAAGLSLADAYAIASNAEDAALIAHGATTAQIAELTAKTREAEKATKDLAAAQSVANTAMDTKEKNALATRLAADSSLTDIQKRFLLENPDAARLYMTPTLDPEALRQALLDAQNAGTYEFNINRVTIPGLQEIWKKGMSNAAEAFSAQENAIKINFDIQRSPFEDIVEAGQRAIADIQNRAGGLDDLDADLQRISNKEFEINKAYDEKVKALDEVAKINDKIIAQQKSQLGLADALSRGDIAGAAKAAQDMRAQASAGSIADQKSMLDASRKSQIDALKGESGLTREEIEEKIRDLKQQILEIEEKRIEPAQRQMELLERMQQDQIDALTVLGKTREEWDAINTSLELANTKTKEFQDAMREALTIATTLGTALATGVVPTIGSMPTPAPTPAPSAPARAEYSYPGLLSSGSRGDTVKKLQSALNTGGAGLEVDGIFGPKTRQAVINFQTNQGIGIDGVVGPQTWRKLYDVKYYGKGGKVAYMSKGGKMSYMALGGMAKMFAKGTDTIPAMLSAGEFVMQKSAVDKIGVGRLAELNRGYDKNINNNSDSVYNYSISVNASTNANPREIANTVLDQIKQIDQQRVRGNRFNYAQ